MRWDSLTEKERNRNRPVLFRDTGRVSTYPPDAAPFDFGIDIEWYENHKDQFREILDDYFTYGNPDGYTSDFEED